MRPIREWKKDNKCLLVLRKVNEQNGANMSEIKKFMRQVCLYSGI